MAKRCVADLRSLWSARWLCRLANLGKQNSRQISRSAWLTAVSSVCAGLIFAFNIYAPWIWQKCHDRGKRVQERNFEIWTTWSILILTNTTYSILPSLNTIHASMVLVVPRWAVKSCQAVLHSFRFTICAMRYRIEQWTNRELISGEYDNKIPSDDSGENFASLDILDSDSIHLSPTRQ